MEIKITGKNFDVTRSIKDYVRKRLNSHIDKVLLKPTQATVVLTVNKKYRQVADVTMNTIHQTIQASAQSEDMYSSIDLVVDKVARQAQKIKEKLTLHNIARKGKASTIGEMSNDEKKIILNNDKFFAKPMSVDEAVLQLEALEYNFFVFRNSNDKNISIVYKRDTSTYGLINNLGSVK